MDFKLPVRLLSQAKVPAERTPWPLHGPLVCADFDPEKRTRTLKRSPNERGLKLVQDRSDWHMERAADPGTPSSRDGLRGICSARITELCRITTAQAPQPTITRLDSRLVRLNGAQMKQRALNSALQPGCIVPSLIHIPS